MANTMEIRNIAIIAHVDHGKTTLTDALMQQTGVALVGVSMDSNDLERERGITIYAKNASVFYPPTSSGRAVTKINIVDTPGHADFGSEVERVLRSIDSVLLVIDAAEGPMPQTRFVLKKSLELGLKPIVIINKIDKPAADPALCGEQVLELFLELGASNEQSNFPVIYAIGREGIAKKNLSDNSTDLTPLLDTILSHVSPASSDDASQKSALAQPFNLGYDNFLGRLAVVRIYEGVLKVGQLVYIKTRLPTPEAVGNGGQDSLKEDRTTKITKIFSFRGLEREEVESASAGDIVLVAGLVSIDIGETIAEDASALPLPMIAVDEPTIALNLMVNSSAFAGHEGKFVTSRQIRERLEKELEVNVGLKVDFSQRDAFKIYGRGELHISILLENMRREGYECQVSQPQVIMHTGPNGETFEPFEEVVIDIPQIYQGTIIERLGKRKFVMTDMKTHSESVRLILEGPTRGLLGYRSQFILDTKGEGIISSRFVEFRPFAGEIQKRNAGSMVSMTSGKTLGFALWNLQDRGVLYINPSTEVYEGMVIGNTSKGEEMYVNPTKGKQLTNMRASGSDEAIQLVPPFELSIERGLEVMAEDEYLEVTPKSVRLRKQTLTKNMKDRNA